MRYPIEMETDHSEEVFEQMVSFDLFSADNEGLIAAVYLRYCKLHPAWFETLLIWQQVLYMAFFIETL